MCRHIDIIYRCVLPLTTDSDLSGLFDWNTKQLFVLVTAHYQTRNNVSFTCTCYFYQTSLSVTLPDLQPRNQVVLWDRIIRRGDSAVLDMHSAATKYNFFDDGRGLKLVCVVCNWSFLNTLCVHLQGEPECDFAGVVECGPNRWKAAPHCFLAILTSVPQFLLIVA